MEPVDSSQTLGGVVQPRTAICKLETTTGLEALSLLQDGWSYIVVLNRREQPQGLFTSQCTLGWIAPNISGSTPNWLQYASKTLTDLDLQPLPAISVNTTIAEFIERISQYHYSAGIWALIDPRGKFVGVIEVLPLMRQLVRQEKNELPEQSLKQVFRLIEQMPLPLMIHDAEGKVLGMNLNWQKHLDQALTDGDRLIGQTSLHQCCISLDGDKHTWQIETAPLSGEFDGLRIAIAQDITAQEQLAQELAAQNADLIRLNRLKDEFLACMSHELKTPLTSVIGIANLLSSKAIGELNERQNRYVNMIHHSSQHLTVIFNNIMDLAKAETGQLELYPEPISTKLLSEQSIQQAKKLIKQDLLIKGEDISGEPKILLDIDPLVSTFVGDGVRVQQMLVNLLSNALKFTDLKFAEGIEQTTVSLKVRQWEGWIAFTVSDFGIGIPEDKQHLIFQKFQQLENTLTRRFEGTGLGLVLTRHLARLHGGEVTFVSQAGVGSQFTILLPPTPPEAMELSFTQVSAMPSRLVLVVETVPQDVDRLVTTLTAWGYRVVVARSGTEALEKARRLQPCLILLSPDLPLLSGWDVLALLKQDAATEHIRVVMAVNSTDKDTHQADHILLKPFQDSDLNEVLANSSPKTEPLTLLYVSKDPDEEMIDQLQGLGHRLLQADDVDQAEMIARIWHPNLILLRCSANILHATLDDLTQCNLLPHLPILLLGNIPEEVRSKFPHLALYVYDEIDSDSQGDAYRRITASLDKIVKRAVGYLQVPTVLLFSPLTTDILAQSLQQSLHQYLLMAGLQVKLLNDPEQVSRQLETENIDALLITLPQRSPLDQTSEPTNNKWIKAITSEISHLKVPHLPVILIDGNSDTELAELAQLRQIATAVLKQEHAIADLLPTLKRCIASIWGNG